MTLQFGETLRIIRQYHRHKVGETAKLVGMSQGYISELENEKKRASMDVLEAYAGAYGVRKWEIALLAETVGGLRTVGAPPVHRKVRLMLEWLAEITPKPSR